MVKIQTSSRVETEAAVSFRDFIAGLGITPPNELSPGKWQRCSTISNPPKKNASIKLSEDGSVGFAQDFASMAEPCVWRQRGDFRRSEISQDEIRSRIAAKRKELIEATKTARAFYESCRPLAGSHPYLDAKLLGVEGCSGLRVDRRGDLVVPMLIKESIVSVQRITPDGTKLFWSGATTNGASYTIDRDGATITLVCEGLATGLTLYGAISNCRVIVAFNAGNLARAVVHCGVSGLCAICADNDVETKNRIGKNPGVEGALKAAEVIGCNIVTPLCEDGGTDFDDWRQELLKKERQDNMFNKWKLTERQMAMNARSVIKSHIMPMVAFVSTEQ